MKNDVRPVAITMGDPSGVSTEITIKAWKYFRDTGSLCFFVLSSSHLFEEIKKNSDEKIKIEIISSPDEAKQLFPHAIPIMELPQQVKAVPGKPDPANAKMTLYSISTAVDMVRKKQASSIVTNPINKHVLYQAGFEFPGHTEYLAMLSRSVEMKTSHPVMLLVSPQLKTVPLTIHIALEDVAKSISSELLCETAHIISHDLEKYFGLDFPHIAVAGLNPHAGENGAMGKTEIEIIEPALEKLRAQGVNVTGPYPADTLFHEKARQNYDVVLGMYHDQALIPIKTLGFDEGVNTTLGLPFVRTSPDHGTAYDIAGKGVANPKSLIEAIRLAQSMSNHAERFFNGQ